VEVEQEWVREAERWAWIWAVRTHGGAGAERATVSAPAARRRLARRRRGHEARAAAMGRVPTATFVTACICQVTDREAAMGWYLRGSEIEGLAIGHHYAGARISSTFERTDGCVGS
jgi:hypothetical protein